VRIRVDKERCMGHGRCWTVAPELLTYDEEGFVALPEDGMNVSPDQLAAAEEAVSSCPEEALSLVEE
jgi:ferredoxin